MTLAVLDNLNTQRSAAMPVYQHLAEQLISRISVGKLAHGDRLPTEHELAKELGINRLTVRKSYQLLENKNLVERRRGMGTFISDVKEDTVSVNRNDKVIYFLIPHPIHITLQLESSMVERQMHYGASMANGGNLVQTVPVSKRLDSSLKCIDWDTIRQIPEGARVFVNSMWYRNIIPFLLERNVNGIFLDNQHSRIDCPEKYERLIAAKWNVITCARLAAMEQAVEYLYGLGRRRIAVIKSYKNEPEHPFRQGMIAGHEKCGMIYDEKLYHEIEPNVSFPDLEKEIVELWGNTKFDALICGVADNIKPICKTLTKKLNLQISEDVALMSFSDNPAYLDFDVPVTAIAFPNVNIGHEIVKIFNSGNITPGRSIFHATIIERESTRKGAGAYVNHIFMPEVSLNNRAVSIKT